MKTDRRVMLAGLLPASLALCAALTDAPALAAEGGGSGEIDGKTRTWLKLVSDLSGRATFAVERGDVWGFKPQADDLTKDAFAKRLYGYWGLLARQATAADGAITLKTKGWTFYTHPDSGEIVTEILNPYTGQIVACPPLSGPAYTAVYGAPGAAIAAALDLRQRRLGDHAWIEIDRIARFKPKDATWFKLEADLISYACRAADLDDPARRFIPSTWSHNVVAEWQTWMKMHGTPGHILFKGDGAFIASLDATPAPLKAAIDAHFPGTFGTVKAWS
jgi:hypothetical protein